MDYSFNSIIERNNTTLNNTPFVGVNGSTNVGGGNNNSLKGVRVVSIVLNESHPRFSELGGWSSLGAIMYDEISPSNNLGPGFLKYSILDYPVAYPMNSFIKHYPLINEIVYISNLPNNNLDFNPTSTKQYYLDVINLWNSPHHNAYPLFSVTPPSEILSDYFSAESGLEQTMYDDIAGEEMTQTHLGNYFTEKSNIHPLLPYEGDTIIEGRWGNSIRFGSSINSKDISLIEENTWSDGFGINGDPIIIIRNGQGNRNENGWEPIVEDINKDESSIYLTSNQLLPQINSIFSSLNNNGYYIDSYVSSSMEPPTSLQAYNNPQIVLNSDRILLNAVHDSIILSAPTGDIHLSSNSNIHLDSEETIIDSKTILLGNSIEHIEPMVLGNK